MSPRRRFQVIIDPAVEAHFRPLTRAERVTILEAIEQQLPLEPNVQTRNRKPLRIPNALNVTWELRCGPDNRYRVFYDVDIGGWNVLVLAVGCKRGNRLLIGREEIEL